MQDYTSSAHGLEIIVEIRYFCDELVEHTEMNSRSSNLSPLGIFKEKCLQKRVADAAVIKDQLASHFVFPITHTPTRHALG